MQALLVEEAAKAATGTADGSKDVSLASVESRVAALALREEGQVAAAGEGMVGAVGLGGLELPFSGALREGVLEGLAELQGETEMQTIIEGMGPALKDVFRPGDAILVAVGCAGLPPVPASASAAQHNSSHHASSAVGAATEILVGVLEAAAEPDVKRPFEVFVQEGGAGCVGRALTVRLASTPSPASASGAGAGAEGAPARKAISTVLVTDVSIVPILPRVTKVLVPAFAVSSAGDAVVPAGVVPVVVAARAGGKPVIVVATSLHLCPEHTGEQLGLPATPTAVGSQSTGLLLRPAGLVDMTDTGGTGTVAVVAPLREVLPASLITAYLLDTGLTTAAGVKQLARENYGHTTASA